MHLTQRSLFKFFVKYLIPAMILIESEKFVLASISIQEQEQDQQTWASQEFSNQNEFLHFFLEQRTVVNAGSWQSITPRSYVISLDFTFRNKKTKVIEFNNPPYSSGWSNFSILGRNLLTSRLFDHLNRHRFTNGSGSSGHDKFFVDLPLQDLILFSSQHWADSQSQGYRIEKVNNSDALFSNFFKSHEVSSAIQLRGSSARTAYFPEDPDYFDWEYFPDGTFLFNHPAINRVATFKSLQQLLSAEHSSSLYTLSFSKKDILDLYQQFVSNGIATEHEDIVVIKPSTGSQSEDVLALPLKEFNPPTRNLIDHLKRHPVWVAQAYFPSTPLKKIDSTFESPVGRIFYHLIWDGQNLSIYPLTAYQKLNGVKYSDPQEIQNPQLIGFGPIESSAEFSKDELKIIIGQLNKYMASVSHDLFYLSQNGLLGTSSKARELENRYWTLPKISRNALSEDIGAYTFTLSDPEYYRFQFRKSPIHESLKKLSKQSRSKLYCRDLF